MTEKKEYEMPGEYQNYLDDYAKMLDERAQYAKIILTLPLAVRRRAQPVLRELDIAIERLEAELANEFQQFQTKKRYDEIISKELAKGMEAVEKLFIEIRNSQPQLFEHLKAVVTRDMTDLEEQEFYANIARREAQMKENDS